MIVNCAHDVMVPIHKLVRNPRNPNTHSDEQIRLLAKVIDYQGWRNAIVVSTRSGFIVKGHARLSAAELLELEEVPVDNQDYDSEAQEWADMLADNRLAELAEIDRAVLKDLIEELDTGAVDMELTGYTDNVIEDLMTEFHQGGGLTDDDAVPEATESICRKGDLWSLGNHRLLCGDATLKADVDRLMGNEKADMVCDPPYGMNLDTDYSSMKGNPKALGFSRVGGKYHPPVIGDEKPFNALDVCDIGAKEQFWFGADYYAHSLGDTQHNGSWLVWDKRDEATLDAGFGSCFELIWSKVKHRRLILRHKWFGFMNEKGTDRQFSHPTEKSVALLVDIITQWIKANIYDPFGGSGSTLIACEKLDRRCFMMEIDKHYCDVIIKRWEDFTGKEAVRL